MQEERTTASPGPFITLERDMPWKVQTYASGIIGALPLLIGSFILYMCYTHLDTEPFSKSWGGFVTGGAFALVGLLMEYVFIHQLIASRTPRRR